MPNGRSGFRYPPFDHAAQLTVQLVVRREMYAQHIVIDHNHPASNRGPPAERPATIRRLNVLATSSGLSPSCTLRTARIRSASRVAWSSLRASSILMTAENHGRFVRSSKI